jgi:hypothetical protein
MPWEEIGDCGTADGIGDRDRIIAGLKLGATYVKLIWGPPRLAAKLASCGTSTI